CTSRVGVFW
nr:immunoglobulin heavy chain junction region [Homo sapiens]